MKMAVWAHPTSDFREGADTLRHVRERLGALRAAGISAYIPFVLSHGKACFESETLGRPERDLLAPVMEAARELEMEVHPIVGFGALGVAGGRVYSPGEDAEDVPEWAASWACASWGENHEIVVRVATDLVEDYSPDGIHLDYARYPNASVLSQHPCACERCQAARARWLGKPTLDADDLAIPGIAYKELQMRGEFVRSLVESLRALADGHNILVSAATRARYYRDALYEGQDWAEWCRDGLLDVVCPMSYNPCFGRFARFLDQHRALVADTATQWLAGIGRRSSLGELSPEEMARQIRYAETAGADGVCIFHARALGDEDLSLLMEIAAEG